jgi:hypothetical protein
LKKYLVVGREKRSILQDSGKSTAHREQSETRNITELCVALFHRLSCFEKYHSMTNC